MGHINVPKLVSGGGAQYIKRDVTNGKLEMPSGTYTLPNNITELSIYALIYAFYYSGITSVNLSNITTVGEKSLFYAFEGCTSLTTVDLSSLVTCDKSSLQHAFYGCTALTSVNLSSVQIAGAGTFNQCFDGCSSLTTVNLSSLKEINGMQGLAYTFRNCTSLTYMPLTELETVSSTSGLTYAFYGCTGLSGTITFSKLKTVSGDSCFGNTFAVSSGTTTYITAVNFPVLDTLTARSFPQCFRYNTALTSISFPALTSTSFGSATNQFNTMLSNVTGCTVHFPSNLQSVIGNWTDVTAGFGGTNTIVLFDLPATS